MRSSLPRHPQRAQSLVVMALMLVVLLGGVALVLDIGIGYYYNARAERAAAAEPW